MEGRTVCMCRPTYRGKRRRKTKDIYKESSGISPGMLVSPFAAIATHPRIFRKTYGLSNSLSNPHLLL